MDETTDVSGKEQAYTVVRFVDSEDIVHERLIGLSAVSKADTETLFKQLKDTLISHDLSLSQIRGQCYDGASKMSGQYSGLQTRLKLESPKHSMCIVMHTPQLGVSGCSEEQQR